MKLTTPMQITAADSDSRTITAALLRSMSKQMHQQARLFLLADQFSQVMFF